MNSVAPPTSPSVLLTVCGTLDAALNEAALTLSVPQSELSEVVRRAAGDLREACERLLAGRSPHPAAPPLRARNTMICSVTAPDTAATMGHPDPSMAVLASPRLGLWFEQAATALMPTTSIGLRHVGVGLVVHHLGAALIGDEVEVKAEVVAVRGRAVMFSMTARTNQGQIATGAHHRLIVDQHGADRAQESRAHGPTELDERR